MLTFAFAGDVMLGRGVDMEIPLAPANLACIQAGIDQARSMGAKPVVFSIHWPTLIRFA